MATMSGKKIVVAVDGSETAGNALRFALQLSADLGCRVTAVTAVQTAAIGYSSVFEQYTRIQRFIAWTAERAAQVAADSGITALETVAVKGDKDVSEQLVDFLAANADVGFLVMGSHGGGIHKQDALGSTTERLIHEVARRQIKTPVLVVPCGSKAGN